MVDVGLFKSFVFSALLIAAFLIYLSTAALTPVLSLLFQEEYGTTPQNAGMLLGLQALAVAISAPLAGRLSDKTSPSAVSAGAPSSSPRRSSRIRTWRSLAPLHIFCSSWGLASPSLSCPTPLLSFCLSPW